MPDLSTSAFQKMCHSRVHTEHWKWFSMTFHDLFMSIYMTQCIVNLAEPSLTVDNENVRNGRKHVPVSKMWQPFGLFSMTFHVFSMT